MLWPLTDGCLVSIIISFHPTFLSRGPLGERRKRDAKSHSRQKREIMMIFFCLFVCFFSQTTAVHSLSQLWINGGGGERDSKGLKASLWMTKSKQFTPVFSPASIHHSSCFQWWAEGLLQLLPAPTQYSQWRIADPCVCVWGEWWREKNGPFSYTHPKFGVFLPCKSRVAASIFGQKWGIVKHVSMEKGAAASENAIIVRK